MAYNTASPGAMSGYGASAFSVPGANLYNGFPAELAGPGVHLLPLIYHSLLSI